MSKKNITEFKVKELPYAYDKLEGISKQVNEWHHDKHYAGYVAKRNEIMKKLAEFDKSAANANYSEFGELKRRESFNASGAILHEIYYDNMGGNGKIDENLEIVKAIKESYGSIEEWKQDFVATAKASLGWAILSYDPSDKKMRNFLCDFHNNGAVWGAIPLIAIDVFEHAYYFDYGPDRATYIQKYLENLNWEKINEMYLEKIKR